jgi:hypothetical protein
VDALTRINQMFETHYASLDEITDHELLRMYVALRCAQLGAQVFVCAVNAGGGLWKRSFQLQSSETFGRSSA